MTHEELLEKTKIFLVHSARVNFEFSESVKLNVKAGMMEATYQKIDGFSDAQAYLKKVSEALSSLKVMEEERVRKLTKLFDEFLNHIQNFQTAGTKGFECEAIKQALQAVETVAPWTGK